MRIFIFAIVIALGWVGAAAANEAAPADLLQSTDPTVREQAVHMIVESHDQSLYGHLRISLSYDLSPPVRAAAARAMASLGLAQFSDLLKTVSRRDPDPQVRQAAAQAYEELWPLEKRPRVAAGLSLLCPGCGHFYLRQPGKAALLLGSTGALLASGLELMRESNYRDLSLDRSGDVKSAVAIPLLMGAQNMWFYSIFAAYRDARLMRHNQGYQYPVSQESLGDLLLAPVNPKVLARPWFWAGLPVMMGAVVGFSMLADSGSSSSGRHNVFDGQGVRFLGRNFRTGPGFALGEIYYASLFFPVGMGEEALFRGVLQPSLSESFGPYTGWALSSLVFGAVHIGNFVGQSNASDGWLAVPFITVIGSYLGYVSMVSGNQLSTSVALHAWYDFLLGTAAFITDPDHQPFAVRVAIPW
jgi:membrane protease YdiL (CAAX protease family)